MVQVTSADTAERSSSGCDMCFLRLRQIYSEVESGATGPQPPAPSPKPQAPAFQARIGYALDYTCPDNCVRAADSGRSTNENRTEAGQRGQPVFRSDGHAGPGDSAGPAGEISLHRLGAGFDEGGVWSWGQVRP